MESLPDQSGEYVIESETDLQAESSTLDGLGLRSFKPALDLLLVIVPISNNASGFPSFIEAIESQLEPPFSVLVVYDDEQDSTLRVATEFAKSRPWLDLVPNTVGPGRANALRAGFQAAGHGPTVVMSIDGSDDPRDLARMRRLYAEGHSIVAGSRDMRGGKRRDGSGLNRMIDRILCRFSGLPLTDPTHSFRLYDASVVNDLGIDSQHPDDIPLELATKAHALGLPLIEIPTTWTDTTSASRRWRRLLRLPARLWRTWRRPATPALSTKTTKATGATESSVSSS